MTTHQPKGAIVIFAKCPIPGSSKTRLSELVGDEGSAALAKAMLSDVLLTVSHDERLSQNTIKFLVFGPGDVEGERIMTGLLSDLNLSFMSNLKTNSGTDTQDNNVTTDKWYLLPMVNTQSQNNDGKNDLSSSDLGYKLANSLIQVRNMLKNNETSNNNNNLVSISEPSVVFLGMDAPEIPIHEIAYALDITSTTHNIKMNCSNSIIEHWNKDNNNNLQTVKKAYINPANDGGYGMICVPFHAPPSIFQGVRWSSPLTTVSQLKALSDNGVDTILGSLMNDIDEPEDVMHLAIRLCLKYSSTGSSFSKINDKIQNDNEIINMDRLSRPSEKCHQQQGNVESEISHCLTTFETLLSLGLIHEKQQSSVLRYNVNISKFQNTVLDHRKTKKSNSASS